MVEQRERRLYLSVPFDDRQEARRRGARWDRQAKRWYVPNGIDPALFARWAGVPVSADPAMEFADALIAAGLILRNAPLMDSALHRVPVQGDKPGAKSGAYIGHLDHRPSGFIQNFKTGEKRNWSAAPATPLATADRARLDRRIAEERKHRQAERDRIHAETARLLQSFLGCVGNFVFRAIEMLKQETSHGTTQTACYSGRRS